MKKHLLLIILYFFILSAYSQTSGRVSGVLKHNGEPISGAYVLLTEGLKQISNDKGYFEFNSVPYGTYKLIVTHVSFEPRSVNVLVNKAENKLSILLKENSLQLEEVTINDKKVEFSGMTRLKSIEGTIIYEGKKNDVILLEKMDANTAQNNTRQVFSKIAGVNIWENDGSGIQVNVSTRGLSPNRSWEFNTRQNGYDISADILGYPDTYYAPPLDAVKSIEVVRGAASLQYGTQLGGLLNFRLKTAPEDKPFEVETMQTRGSFNLFNSFTGIGGNKGKLSYYGYFHHRSSDGWRQNSDYRWNTGFASLSYQINEKIKLGFEMTSMQFLLHLSAGLTDELYEANPQVSVRERNWFQVQWNLPVMTLDYDISDNTKLNLRSFVLSSFRNSIEFTKPVDIPDDNGFRDLRKDEYLNFGTEIRVLSSYHIFSVKNKSSVSAGLRIYNGRTKRGQGLGTGGTEPEFIFINPGNLEYSDYEFHSNNYSFFIENLFWLSDKFSVTPGIRYELIEFTADGYYGDNGQPGPTESLKSNRNFPLLGVGLQYHLSDDINLYGNYTQGYRSANFNDIRVTNPNLVVDTELKDSHGFNIDWGVRGAITKTVNFDINGFYLGYNDKIGSATRMDANGNAYQFRTNVANSRNLGIESMVDVNLFRIFKVNSQNSLSYFNSYAYVNSEYTKSEEGLLDGNRVELAPEHILRSGLTFKTKKFSTTLNYSYISEQFSDANNTVVSTNGNQGLIKAYYVMDISASYQHDIYRVSLSVNNLTDNKYYTRRATSYPGPGLIPSDPRSIAVTFGVKL